LFFIISFSTSNFLIQSDGNHKSTISPKNKISNKKNSPKKKKKTELAEEREQEKAK
jgi:hypothetical protein